MKYRYSRNKLAWLGGLLATLFTTSVIAETPIHHVTSDTCKTCHKEIYSQWKSSMHAQSSALKDPIHGAFYGMVIGDPKKEGQKSGKGTYPICLQCHAPNAAKDKTTKLDANPAYAEGVNCVVCHTLAEFKGTTKADGKPALGMIAYKTSTNLQGPSGFKTEFNQQDDVFGDLGGSDSEKPNPHLGKAVEVDGKQIPSMPMVGNPKLMKTNDACMGCHDKRSNSNKVPLCRTGDEYAEGGADVTCTSCHMPIAGGVADHGMGGGHDNAMLERGVVFSIESTPAGGKLKTVATIRNKQPHSLPTGAPFRNIYMVLSAYDDAGNVLWQNTKGHPINDDPQAYFNYELLDDAGKHSAPPKAKAVGPDNRLKAFETRELTYEIPAAGVTLVRGELFYNLLWPEFAKKFSKKFPEELTSPQSIAFSEVKL